MLTSAIVLSALTLAAGLPEWTFDTPGDVQGWSANGDLANVQVRDGALIADATGADPILMQTGLDFPAEPYQYLVIRIRASKPGTGQVFWTGTVEGRYGGLTEQKSARWDVRSGAWQDIAIFPFWQAEGTIRTIRIDVYEGAHIEIDSIRVETWGHGAGPNTDTYTWTIEEGIDIWQSIPNSSERFAPPLLLDISDRGWVTMRLRADEPSAGELVWAAPDSVGRQTQAFAIRGDGETHTYNIQMDGNKGWKDTICAFGLRLPETGNPQLESIAIAEDPSGPADLEVTYFGFENGVNRVGKPATVIAQIVNHGTQECLGDNESLLLPYSQDPRSIIDEIGLRGASAVVLELNREPDNWSHVIDQIAQGTPQWLAVSDKLWDGVDGHAAEGLAFALGRALAVHPEESLSIITRRDIAELVDPAASLYGLTSREAIAEEIQRLLATLSSVDESKLIPIRDQFVHELSELLPRLERRKLWVDQSDRSASFLSARLALPASITCTKRDSYPSQLRFRFEEPTRIEWRVQADAPENFPVQLVVDTENAPTRILEAVLRFYPASEVATADYVPPPQPVETDIDVCAYYFPGWDSPAKWDPIRRVAPNRKPLLGYYDEADPECVDWQIKWARENGINTFLVDWYWIGGKQHLTHWFEAYRTARYRDQLNVAIMWANHNPPDTHSAEDWRNVTREWIDRYFNFPAYYRVNGKPAVFLWDPRNLRNDLGGSGAVRAALDESQAMAKAAGYAGIEFIVVNGADSESLANTLHEEGYAGATNYHEWGDIGWKPGPCRADFSDVTRLAPEAWARRNDFCAPLTYYPLIDTGWDARPWHGENTLVIDGRTPERFEQLLQSAKAFCAQTSKPFVVLGPVNEWGEGSYIEPCTEFGFDMLERVRSVFAKGDPATWPANVAPADVGLGPYDYPPIVPTTRWNFDKDANGWAAMMNVSDLRVEDGALVVNTMSPDPALVVALTGVNAAEYSTAHVTMQMIGDLPDNAEAQLFWSVPNGSTSEAASVRIRLEQDGRPHEYEFHLCENRRWRGPVSSLRLDPCNAPGITVRIERIELK